LILQKKYNTEYINNRVLQFHINYDLLSATNTIGTVVNLPSQFNFSHSLSNYNDFDWTPYENFVKTGLQYNNPFNPIDTVIAEDQPAVEPDVPINEDDDADFDQAAPTPREEPKPIITGGGRKSGTPDPEPKAPETIIFKPDNPNIIRTKEMF
jgi:hypothetical protein